MRTLDRSVLELVECDCDATGVLTGVLELVGGSSANQPQGVPGTITLTPGGAGRPISAPAAADGKFSVRAPAASYVVTGHSPSFVINDSEGTCVVRAASPTAVTAGESTTVTVECAEK